MQSRPAERISATLPLATDSLALFDRREQMHFAVRLLSLPQLSDGARAVKISPDQRQALCYQCHAPRQPDTATVAAANHWGPQIGSGDDRTPVGVHEGISCLACHAGHNENAHRLLQNLSSANVPLRHRRREDGHDLRQREKPPQHPLGPLRRLPSARHPENQDIRPEYAKDVPRRSEWVRVKTASPAEIANLNLRLAHSIQNPHRRPPPRPRPRSEPRTSPRPHPRRPRARQRAEDRQAWRFHRIRFRHPPPRR